MTSFNKFREAQDEQMQEDRERAIRDFLQKSLSLLEECCSEYKSKEWFCSEKELLSLKNATEKADFLYKKRDSYEKFILKSFLELFERVLFDTKNNLTPLLAFSSRTIHEMFFKKLMFFLENPTKYKKEKLLFVLNDASALLKEDSLDWFTNKSEEIKKILSEKEFEQASKIIEKIAGKNSKPRYFSKFSTEAKKCLNNDKSNAIEEQRFKFIEVDWIYHHCSQKIHGNPFMLETFINSSEKIKYQIYILLYETSLNCLNLILESGELDDGLNSKVNYFLDKEEGGAIIKNKLVQSYKENK